MDQSQMLNVATTLEVALLGTAQADSEATLELHNTLSPLSPFDRHQEIRGFHRHPPHMYIKESRPSSCSGVRTTSSA